MKSILVLLLTLAFFSCKKKQPQSEIDENTIKTYISDNNLNAQSTESGLYYTINKEGIGISPNISSTVTVAYKGYLTDGNVFDESTVDGLKIPLANVIEGWQEGIPLFKEGGKGTLLIPSALGYGAQGSGEIPKNAVIIFDIHLIKVE